MHTLYDKDALFAFLAKGTIIITPNNRLSESIIQQYFHQTQSKTIEKPMCLPYGVVLAKAYEHCIRLNPQNNYPILINTAQCQHLWRILIQAQEQITFSEGLLESVMNAWERCELWQINPEDPNFNYTPQTQQFQFWRQQFNTRLNELNLITEYQLVSYITNSKTAFFSKEVVWACFDEFTPQQQKLQNYLQQQGVTQYHYDLKKRSNTTKMLAAKDNQEELQQLILWLKEQLPQASKIGVVIPDLQQKSFIIQRALAQHFEPLHYNISLGQALSDFPLVAHALCWLQLDDKKIKNHEMSLLLQSPYLGFAQQEFTARSEYLQNASLMEKQNCSNKELVQSLISYAPNLADLIAKITPYPQQASIYEWIELFTDRLNTLGFPGDRGLSSENYQCFNRFTLIFDEMRQLGLLTPHLHRNQALSAINALVRNTVFQAQKNHTTIQISGFLEASGCEFDRLWVMGLTDQCLPQKIRLSAFIPPQLQREQQMPHSLPARELQFAKKTLQRLQYSAEQVVFSYAAFEEDTPNLPCSLITHLDTMERFANPLKITQQPVLLSIDENYEIPLKTDEPVSGGTALLANQAKCPFKAFAAHRLHAKALPLTADGIDPLTKGAMIHKIMELLWKDISNQQNLFLLEHTLLEQKIEHTIETVLNSLKNNHSPAIQEIEMLRLKRIVHACFQWEKQRPPFSVTAVEEQYKINLAGLEFKVRVDRLDKMADKKWVIDYKSNIPGSKPWNEERPKEPQLLLYALLDPEINTLLFVQLKTGNITCSGLSEEKQELIGMSTIKKEETWKEHRANWQDQLTLLAQEFQNGYCPPKPNQITICQQCDYQNLCRFQKE